MDSEEIKLFVGGIPRETREDTLRDYFGKYGNVVSSVVAKDRLTGSPRGFAFVSFSDQSAVDRVLQQYPHIIFDRKVEVKRAIPKNEQQQNQQPHSTGSSRNSRINDNFRTKKIFVGGLSSNLSEEMFRSFFEKFGKITDVVVMHDSVTKRPRGFGFITFDSEDSVEDVVQKSFYEICGKSVEVKKAVPKEATNHSNNVNTMRVNGGQGPTLNNYPHMNYSHYPPSYGFHPGHGSFPGYDGSGYFYGGHLYGGGYPTIGYDGMYHGVAPVTPRIPWNGHMFSGVGGSPFPYFSAPNVYPTYLNGVAGTSGVANGHNGIVDSGVHENLARLSLGDAQVVTGVSRGQINGENADVNTSEMDQNGGTRGQINGENGDGNTSEMDQNCGTRGQINGEDVDVKTSEMDQSCGAAANEENQRGIDAGSRVHPDADSG